MRTTLVFALLLATAGTAKAQSPRVSLTVNINRDVKWDSYIEAIGGAVPVLRCPNMYLTIKTYTFAGEFPVYSPGLTDNEGHATLYPSYSLATIPPYSPPRYGVSRCTYFLNPVVPVSGATYHVTLNWICPSGTFWGMATGGWDFYTVGPTNWSANVPGVFNAKGYWNTLGQTCGMNMDTFWYPSWARCLHHQAQSGLGFVLDEFAYWEGGPTSFCPADPNL